MTLTLLYHDPEIEKYLSCVNLFREVNSRNGIDSSVLLSKEELQPVFYKVCYILDVITVTELLRLGGDPLWANPDGVTCTINAALSPIDARKKLRVLQSKGVSILNYVLILMPL